ncbi:aldehyde dehydrogenase PuuC [Acidihalobacter aeolianus]|uniref:Aldehyde dehydrogenase PuuC n=1 Tax=Acidihalobacter aeolianus TaxID=2792603 RepID=A0A1D8K6H2_9GAMM|nr:aldehyde dehydrogenase [Acidihalobacter aeolianus]AOV16575.1 aldehyde dehydrogenase PuuC [Acidihalobacter aeolianus]
MSSKYTLEDWRAKAAALKIKGRAFVDGRYVDAVSGKTFDCINPATGAVLARIAECDAEDAERAVAAARRVFEDGAWSRMAPRERKTVLIRFAQLIEDHAEELALLESLDAGKPIGDTTRIDIPAAVRCVRFNGEAVDKLYDEVAPTPDDALGLITREPVGVVAAIVPWNFPILMASWKFAPALAAGNSVILKPSEKAPLTAIRVAELAQAAGIPDGVFNVLPGFGGTVGKVLALHMDVDCVAFTGSTAVGKQIMQYAGQSNLKRAWMECGGKTPNIVFADCPDLDAAARAAAFGIFYNQGEMCTAGSRLLVEASIKDAFLEKVIAAGEAMQPGDPLDPATRMGAIVDDIQLDRVMGYIEAGQAGGATLRLGGERVMNETGGYFIAPTIFDNVTNDMKIAREEIFGPVLSTIAFTDEAEAIRIANDSPYGLAAAVWTSNLSRGHRVARRLRAGSVWVNCFDEGDMTVPFGGYKQSGNGRDKSLHAIDKYVELKATWIDLSR